jgi:hypothetical protein
MSSARELFPGTYGSSIEKTLALTRELKRHSALLSAAHPQVLALASRPGARRAAVAAALYRAASAGFSPPIVHYPAHSVASPASCVRVLPGGGVERHGGFELDVGRGRVDTACAAWEQRCHAYVWGAGDGFQLGSGWTLGGALPLHLAASQPLRLRLLARALGAAPLPAPGALVERAPRRVFASGSVTAVLDSQRCLWVAGRGWLGRGAFEVAPQPLLLEPPPGGGAAWASGVAEVAFSPAGFALMACCDGSAWVWGENASLAGGGGGGGGDGGRRDADGEGRAVAGARVRALLARGDGGGGAAPYADSRHSGSEAQGGAPLLRRWLPHAPPRGGHPLGLSPGEPHPAPFPRPLLSLTGCGAVEKVAAGAAHAVVLTKAGWVFAWGAGDGGQCGQGAQEAVWAPARVALGQGGGGGERACAIAAGAYHTLALDVEGGVWAWGVADDGRLGLGPPARGEAAPAAAGEARGGLRARERGTPAPAPNHPWDGTAACCVPVPARVPGLPLVVAVAAGTKHSLCLAADGRVWACGDNSRGQCGVGRARAAGAGGAPPPAAARAANATEPPPPGFRMGAARTGGALPGVGLARTTLAVPGARVVAERTVWAPRPIFTHAFGAVLCLRVAAGGWHSAAVSLEGHLWAWGANESGQCGAGDELTSPEPARVARLEGVNVCAEALGARHTAVLVERGMPSAKISLALIDDADDWGDREAAEEDAAAAAAAAGGAPRPPCGEGDGTPRGGAPPGFLGARLPPQLRRARWKFLTVRRNAAAYGVATRRALAAGRRAQGSDSGKEKLWLQDADDAELGKHAAAWVLQRMYREWKAQHSHKGRAKP